MRMITPEELAKYIEFTNLDNTATEEQMIAFLEIAEEYNFYAVVVSPHYVNLASTILKDTDIKVVTVIDFPLGAGSTEGKVAEVKAAIENGADEIDMVANIPAIKSHDFELVEYDIKSVKEACEDTPLKVIIECPLIDDYEKSTTARICDDCKVDYVKTSTGFNGVESFNEMINSIKVIKKNAPHTKIKAAGGISNYKTAYNIISSGVDKIGASSGKQIIDQLKHVHDDLEEVGPTGPRLI